MMHKLLGFFACSKHQLLNWI